MKNRIKAELETIENNHQVRILYACESGSRAWGFESADSDWDVRFLYLHPPEWYLSVDLESKRDVIEWPPHDDLDICGWELRKALNLFRKSNPPMIEWLHSPIVYRDENGLARCLRELLGQYYSPRSCFYHYLHMAKGNYREYLKGETVWLKKYLYVLRPILALRWIDRDLGSVPVRFSDLIDATAPSGPLRKAIDRLIVMKKQGLEKKHGPRIPEINHFLDTEITRFEGRINPQEKAASPIEPLNDLFRKMLDEVWEK